MAKECNNPDCSVSTGIHDGLTFGRGRLTFNGFWEHPCAVCARAWESAHPDDGECWPFNDQDVSEQAKSIQEELAREDKLWNSWGDRHGTPDHW